MSVFFHRIDPSVKQPMMSANHDKLILYSRQNFIIPPQSQYRLSTGLSILIPQGCYGRFETYPTHLNAGIHVDGQEIRENHREEIEILLLNSG